MSGGVDVAVVAVMPWRTHVVKRGMCVNEQMSRTRTGRINHDASHDGPCRMRIHQMTRLDMNQEQARGALKKAIGKVQEEIGKLTGSKSGQINGVEKQVNGKFEETIGDLKEAIKDLNKIK